MGEPGTLTVQDDEGHRGGHRRERRGGGDDEDQQEGDDGGQRGHRLPVRDRGLGLRPLSRSRSDSPSSPRWECAAAEMVNWAEGEVGED